MVLRDRVVHQYRRAQVGDTATPLGGRIPADRGAGHGEDAVPVVETTHELRLGTVVGNRRLRDPGVVVGLDPADTVAGAVADDLAPGDEDHLGADHTAQAVVVDATTVPLICAVLRDDAANQSQRALARVDAAAVGCPIPGDLGSDQLQHPALLRVDPTSIAGLPCSRTRFPTADHDALEGCAHG